MKYLSQKKGFLGYDANQNIEPKVIVVPFGLEKTVSYGGGTKNGPKEIIKASHQVELFDEELRVGAVAVATLLREELPRLEEPVP